MDQGSKEQKEEEERGMNMKELLQVVKDIEGNAPRSQTAFILREGMSGPFPRRWDERERERQRPRER